MTKAFARIALIFFVCLLVSYFYQAITSLPNEGDSLVYHIPIANSILNGQVFKPQFTLGFYPGNAEAILALLIKLHIPLNLFNFFALVLLFYASRKLGLVFGLKKDLASVFSVGFCTLPAILRWLPTQVIDIWLAVFFVACLILLEKPKSQNGYFLKLGLAFGLLIGTKYSGPLFAAVLFLAYFTKIKKYLNWQRTLIFLFPLILFGLSWYLRNCFLTGNPFYPQQLLFFKGLPEWNQFKIQRWQVILRLPRKTADALVSEFLFWPVLLFPLFVFIIRSFLKKQNKNLAEINRPVLLGLICFLIYFFLPASYEYQYIVSTYRYTYPAFILLIIGLFLLAQKVKKEEEICLITLSGLLFLPPLNYHPKLVFFVLIPLLIYFRKKKNSKNLV